MSISFKKKGKDSIRLAFVNGGSHDKSCVYYNPRQGVRTKVTNKNNDIKFNDKHAKQGKKSDKEEMKEFLSKNISTKEEMLLEDERIEEILNNDFFKMNKIRDPVTIKAVKDNIRERKEPKKEHLDIFIKSLKEYNDKFGESITINDGVFEIIPILDIKNQFPCVLAVGGSGSGKSTNCSQYIDNYFSTKTKNDCYLFSNVESDKILDKHKEMRRIALDNDLIRNPISSGKELEKSLCIFDDIDTCPNKLIRDSVLGIRDLVLETHRHDEIALFVTSHCMFSYNKTRLLLRELTGLIFYPRTTAHSDLKRFFIDTEGYTTKDLRKFKNTGSRWVYYNRAHPKFIMTESEIYLIN